jgi:WD40 repeat protein/class 3 adenylate cyclase
MLQVRLLGQFDVRLDGKRVIILSRAGQSLFAFLILTAGTHHRREKLAGTFWPDKSEETARKNLRQELWRIRKSLSGQKDGGNEFILANEFTIAFNRSSDYWLDAAQVERPDLDLESLTVNLSLYQGELLPGFYDEWITSERGRIQSIFDIKMGQLLEQLVASERWTAIQEQSERWLALSNTTEPAYRALMLAHGARGNMAKVSTVYQRCITELNEELGIEPSAETRSLYDGLLKGANVRVTTPAAQPSGTVTFLFTDIEESTSLLDTLGDRYTTVLADHHGIIRSAIEKWNGREVDTQGDAFFVTFSRALDAVQCAVEAQRALSTHNWPQNKPLLVRMGLHTGEPLIASTGYVGMDVHRAARIGDAAHGGQILISHTTRELVFNDLPKGLTIRDLGEHRLKDLKFPTSIYQLSGEGLPLDFPPIRTKFSGTESPTPGEPPFKGLQYFDTADENLFFGRELLTAKLVNRLRDSRFLSVVIGASGSGKSSLVRAGVVPALKRGQELLDGTKPPEGSSNWQVHIITPTAHPIEALAIELTRTSESVMAAATLMDDMMQDPRSFALFLARQHPDTHILLVLDQFEELFTLCRDEFEREAFIDNLLAAISPSNSQTNNIGRITIIVTLRADFYAHLAQYPELREVVASQQEYIGPMTIEELRRAIEEPARRAQWAFEPGLVDLILRDVGDEPGALPLLSHALLETWKRRAGHTLTLKGYADAGGVRGAISHTAENIYQTLSAEEQGIARNIFLRLTELGEGTEDTRRRASLDELMTNKENGEETSQVLNQLAEARLITLSENMAEVAHEALIREWHTLREWLNQDRESLRLHRNITEGAQEWELLERDPGILYRGSRLSQAREWAGLHPNALNASERAFLEASNNLEKQEQAEREAQQQRELEAARKLAETERQSAIRMRMRNRVITVVGVIATLLAVLAFFYSTQSNINADRAEKNAQSALIAQAAAEANSEAANQAKAEAEAQQRLAMARELAASADNTLTVDPELSILLALQGVQATAADGFTLPEVENALHRAIAASRVEKTLNAHEGGGVWAVVYNAAGTQIVTAGQDGKVNFWDTKTYDLIFTIKAHEGGTNSVAFSPDEKHIATAGDDGLVHIWDATTQERLVTMKGHTDMILAVQYRPDGKQLMTTSVDGTLIIWDEITGEQSTSISLNDPVVFPIYDNNGSTIMFVDNGELQYRDADNGLLIRSILVSKNDHVFALSPDETRLAVISVDTTFISILNASDFKSVVNIRYPTNQLEAMSFSPDGSLLAAVGRDRKVHIWDTTNGLEVFTLAGHAEFIFSLAFSPDGKHLTSGGFEGVVKIWSLEASKEVLTIPTPPFYTRFALSPDGTHIAANGIYDPVSGNNNLFMVWDAQNGNLLFQHKAHDSSTRSGAVVFSPDGKEIATGGDHEMTILDAASGEPILRLPVDNVLTIAIAYDPNGQIIAVVGDAGKIQLFERATGKLLQNWDPGMRSLSNVIFSPDGSRLAVVSNSTNDAKVFDVKTEKEILVLQGHSNNNWGIDFNSDGTRIVTAGRDATARIWDADTGELLVTFVGHTSTIGAVRFSPDDTRIATSSADGTVRLWDVFTGRQLLEIEGFAPSVEFTPDGKRLVAPKFESRGIQIIALDIDELVQIAKSRLTRTWTSVECKKYLHSDVCPQFP